MSLAVQRASASLASIPQPSNRPLLYFSKGFTRRIKLSSSRRLIGRCAKEVISKWGSGVKVWR